MEDMYMKFIETVYAHCDVPCGIYETDSMTHAAATCRRMVEKAIELGDAMDPEHHNQFVRVVMYKEEHAMKAKQQLYLLWSDYFKPEHLDRFPELHTAFWTATKQCGKVKQTMSLEECDTLIALVAQIADMFHASKQPA
jgi:nickel superoxide dismutase